MLPCCRPCLAPGSSCHRRDAPEAPNRRTLRRRRRFGGSPPLCGNWVVAGGKRSREACRCQSSPLGRPEAMWGGRRAACASETRVGGTKVWVEEKTRRAPLKTRTLSVERRFELRAARALRRGASVRGRTQPGPGRVEHGLIALTGPRAEPHSSMLLPTRTAGEQG